MGSWAGVAAAIILCLVPAVAASPAALTTHIATVPPSVDPTTGQVGTRGGYAVTVVVADTAGTLTLTNLDLTAHDLVADELGPTDNPWCPRFVGHHDCPLFASPIAGLGDQVDVEGLAQLEPGTTHEFFCSIHHWMTGTIVAI